MHSSKVSHLKSTTKINIISTVVVLLIVGASVAWYFNSNNNVDNESSPPELALNSLLKGQVMNDSYITFTATDVSNWTDPAGDYITIKSGFNYVYSTSEKSIQDIKNSLKPVAGNLMLIIVHSPSSSFLGQAGYNIYKKGHYSNIDNPSAFKIPAYYGFIIYSSQETKSWGMRNHNTPLSNNEGIELRNALKTVSGWVLIPTPSASNLDQFFLPLQKNILFFSKLKSKNTFNGADFDNGTTGSNNFGLNSNSHFMWIKLGNPSSSCSPGQYFAYGECYQCNSQQYYTGSEYINCVSCPSGVNFTNVSGCSGPECNPPKYVGYTGACLSCQPGYMHSGGVQCKKCTQSEYASGFCEPCSYPTFAFSGNNIGCTGCAFWQKPDSSSKSCVDCGYWQTYNPSTQNCVSCNDAEYYSGKICKTCPDQTPRFFTGNCHSCLPNQFPTGSPGYKMCTNCPPGKIYSGSPGTCVNCTNNQYYGGQCTPCTSPTGNFSTSGWGGSGANSYGSCTY